MEISKILRKPANWQDFETLCKKLWGEIWNCPEIKKNGRLGQAQYGVDIYGTPAGETGYYGIQCKGKDEYTDNQFTEKEIINEIEKAKLFNPKLKKLYFATTAIKDTKIEEVIRIKNLENINNGLFEVHIFSWEDIVELIDENKQTHDYYINSQNYKSKKNVAVTFQNGSNELVVTPKFQKRIKHYLKQQEMLSNKHIVNAYIIPPSTKINKSFCEIWFKIHNIGLTSLEEYKLSFYFEKNTIKELTYDNQVKIGYHLPELKINHSDIKIENHTVTLVPIKNILVGDDIYTSNSFYVKPFPKNYYIKIFWKLISKDFKDQGELKIKVKPNIEDILIKDPSKFSIMNESYIEDMLVEEDKL